MNKVESLFLDLFTSFVRKSDGQVPEDSLTQDEWNRLLTLSAGHKILPIIYEAGMQLPDFKKHPPAVAGFWKQEARMAVVRQTQKTAEFLMLYQEMTEAGLYPLAMKGLICRSLYPKPDYRMSGDEDLLIKREDFQKMDFFLMQRGFQKKDETSDWKIHGKNFHEVGYRHPETGLYLEVHLSLFPQESGAYGHFNQLFEGVQERAVSLTIDGCEVCTLSSTDHFLYLLCHSVKHFMHSGFGVRQLFDMILFAEKFGSEIDWIEIQKKTKKYHIYKFMLHLFDIGVKYFLFDIEKANLPEKMKKKAGTLDSEELLHDLCEGGIYGSASKERLHSANITLAAVTSGKEKNGILASLFPKYGYMAAKYKYVKKYPWLLPLGWLHRLGTFFIKKEKKRSRLIVKTGKERVALLKKYGIIPDVG